jgi:DNA-directed RNA polymerase subunit RPC12/RpoP
MTPTTLALVAGAAAALAVGGYLLLRRRGGREEPYYHFRCPTCRRRLRFRARQAGHTGQCSHCGHGVTFPPTSQSVD